MMMKNVVVPSGYIPLSFPPCQHRQRLWLRPPFLFWRYHHSSYLFCPMMADPSSFLHLLSHNANPILPTLPPTNVPARNPCTHRRRPYSLQNSSTLTLCHLWRLSICNRRSRV